MKTEDFSFPTENFPSSTIDSPPLWRSPAAASSTADSSQEEAQKEEEDISTGRVGTNPADVNPRRSLSCIGHGRRTGKIDGDKEGGNDDREDKMDMLWEDLNEELSRSRGSRADSDVFSGDHQMVELGCVQALKLPKTRNNKPSMVMVLKILKKLFLLQNNSHDHHHHHRGKQKTSRPW